MIIPKEKLQSLINAANSTTTLSDDNMTDAVESLISGYGKGGGGKTATVTITAPTGSIVTLTDGIETLTTVETDGVWTFANVPLGYWTAVAVMPTSTDSIDLGVLEDTSITFYDLSKVVVLPGGSINNSVSDYAVQYEGSGSITAGNQVAGGQNASGALEFRTKSGYGYIPAAVVAREFIFSIRFKASSFNTDGCIIAMHNANNNGINLRIGTTYLEIARNKDAIRRINRTVTLNEWHTVSMRYYGSTNTVAVIIDDLEVIRDDVSGFEGYWTAFKINNLLAGSNWINNHATASYLTMYAEKITLLVG